MHSGLNHTRLVDSRIKTGFFIALTVILTTPLVAGPKDNSRTKGGGENSEFKLKVERNIVLVRVVVRDAEGRPVHDLDKDSFELYDEGKRQAITQFSIEKGPTPMESVTAGKLQPEKAEPAKQPLAIPRRFAAFYFDDVMLKFEDLKWTLAAAEKYFAEHLQPDERVAIFTSSGQGEMGFTADRNQLHDALTHLQPRGMRRIGVACPDLSDYEAYQIAEMHDQDVLDIATEKVIYCACAGDRQHCSNPVDRAKEAAFQDWNESEQEILKSIRGLNALVRKMSILPGQRSIVMISPGFISRTMLQRVGELIDRAVRAGVVVNALDARGLYAVVPGGDASEGQIQIQNGAMIGKLAQMKLVAASEDADVLAEFAEGTGGVFFHNSNDIDAGFRKAGSLESYTYLLSFSPQDIKRDGRYHKLKVKLASTLKGKGYSLQARRGYFAPRNDEDAGEQAREEVSDMVFSSAETNGLPVDVKTSYARAGVDASNLTIEARVDAKALHFRKEDGRHTDELTFISVLFDPNGNYVKGTKKVLTLRLKDSTLKSTLAKGVSLHTEFRLPPGTYLIRQVVKEEGGPISSKNLSVSIPD